MQESSLKRRIDLALLLLDSLNNTYAQIKQTSQYMESNSSAFYKKVYSENRDSVHSEISRYRQNIERINQLGSNITSSINVWFDFYKNSKNRKKLIFPIQFHIKRRELRKNIKKSNEEISKLTIENRFIKEKLTSWEHDLKLKAVQLMKQGSDYSGYEKLMQKKDAALSELKYLLPSIPGVCPINISSEQIEILIRKLKSLDM